MSDNLLNNHHVLLCIGAAIFDVFGVTFYVKHSRKKGNKSAIEGVTLKKSKRAIPALHHLHVWMLTCKRVRNVLIDAFVKKSSYFPLYHCYPWWLISQMRPYYENAFSYIKRRLLQTSDEIEHIMDSSNVWFDYAYSKEEQMHVFYYMSTWTRDEQTAYAKLKIPWHWMVNPRTKEIEKKVADLVELRDNEIVQHHARESKRLAQRIKKRKTLSDALTEKF